MAAGNSRFYLSWIHGAFSNGAIPAGVTALLRSLGAVLPAWVCQKPICMRPANVLEIKAPNCQVNCTCTKQLNSSICYYPGRSKAIPGRGAQGPKQRIERLVLEFKKKRTTKRRAVRGVKTGGEKDPEARAGLDYLKELLSDPGALGAHSFTLRTAGEDIHSLPFFWWRSWGIHVFLTLNNFCL